MAVSDQEKGADERIARLYRDAAHEEPPSHLDSAIHRAARASDLPRASGAQTWWTSWRLPFAFVAVGIVSVSLVTLVLEEGGERLTGVPQSRIAPEAQAPAGPGVAPPAALPAPAEPRLQRESRPPSATTPPSTRERAKTPQEKTEQAKADIAGTQRQSSAADTSSVQPQAAKGDAAASRRSDEASPLQKPLRSPAPVAAPDAAAAANRSAAPAARPAPAPSAVQAAPVPSAAAPMRKSESAASPRAEAAAEIANLEGEPPAVWLERIVILRGAGRHSEADALLAEFKGRFPGAALPPQLQ